MRRFLLCCAVVCFTVTAAPGAHADNSLLPGASQLNEPVQASLLGQTGGRFAYYRFNYQGDNSPFTVTLNSIPGDNMTYANAGFNLIYADRIVGQGQIEPAYGTLDMTYQSSQRGTYFVQVFNYLAGVNLQYAIRVSGLPCRPATEEIIQPGAPLPLATNNNGASPKPLVGSDQGLFVNDTILTQGSNQGTHLYYSVEYPGNNQAYVVNYGFSPADTPTAAGTGMTVYFNGSQLGSAVRIFDGVYQYVISSGSPGTYLFELYNFLPGGTISYGISLLGAACSPQAPSLPVATQVAVTVPPTPAPASSVPEGSNRTPNTAAPIALTGTSSTLAGRSVGSFAFYTFTYPGDNSVIQLKMMFSPNDAVISKGVGFTLFNSSGQIGVSSLGNTPGLAQITYSSGIAGAYTVQVYNYIDGVRLTYALVEGQAPPG